MPEALTRRLLKWLPIAAGAVMLAGGLAHRAEASETDVMLAPHRAVYDITLHRAQGGSGIAGFAGATADAFTLLERLEGKLEQYPDQLMRASVELAKDWRTDRYLRRLEAMMLVADKNVSLALTGNGDVLEPEQGVMAIGSGGNYALAAARALIDTDKDAEEIALKAMQIASDICVYTNNNFVGETIDGAA